MTKSKSYISKVLDNLSVKSGGRSDKSIFKQFAMKVGLVYFGFVDQHSDEHDLIRGLTVSSGHHDNHYCVGSVSGYDIRLTSRSNQTTLPGGAKVRQKWTIMAINLQTKHAIPHFFINSNGRNANAYQQIFTTYPNMSQVEWGVFEPYSSEFTERFSVFARPSKSLYVQKLITASIAQVIAAHLWPLSVEQHDNVLYVYSHGDRITPELLDTMTKNALWIAEKLDIQTDAVHDVAAD